MKKIILSLFLISLSFTLISLPFQPTVGETSQQQVESLIEQGDNAAKKARHQNRTEEQLRKSLNIYQRVLEIDPDNLHALNRLSLGYYMLAEAYLTYSEKKEAYQKGFDYGLRSLRTNPDFRRLHDEKGFSALKDLPQSVVNAHGLAWTAANLGTLMEWKGVFESLDILPALVSLNQRVIELDKGYLGAAAHCALGCISAEVLKKTPLTFWQVHKYGFSWEGTREHFEKAIELSPKNLANYFSYAYYYAYNKDKEDLAMRLLDKVISEPLGDNYPLMNMIAKNKAKILIGIIQT
ncbi:MAG: TRAP transporter TatT component family protein [Candidatus Bipolaricaulota bacterium]